jgi:hypothetical protein
VDRQGVENLVLWGEVRKVAEAYDKMRDEGGYIAYPLADGETLQDGDFDEALLSFVSVLGLHPDPSDPSTQWPGTLIFRSMVAGRQVPDALDSLLAEHFEVVGEEGSLGAHMAPRE